MANGSSSKFGILQVRNGSEQLQLVRFMILIDTIMVFCYLYVTHGKTLLGMRFMELPDVGSKCRGEKG